MHIRIHATAGPSCVNPQRVLSLAEPVRQPAHTDADVYA